MKKNTDDISMTPVDDNLGDLAPVDRYVFDSGYRINMDKGCGFSYLDFTGRYRHGTIRNSLVKLRNRGLIYPVFRSTIAFFAVRGSSISPKYTRKMTSIPTGGLSLLLSMLPIDDDAVHDLRLSFVAKGFYDALLVEGWSIDKTNHDIALRSIKFPNGRIVKVRVHKTGRVTILVGCSNTPFQISHGLSELVLLLDEVRDNLEHEYSKEPVRILPIGSWRLIQWHHGIDGNREFGGKTFNIAFDEWSGHLIRFYSKKIVQGRYHPRLERIETPKKSIEDLVSILYDYSERK